MLFHPLAVLEQDSIGEHYIPYYNLYAHSSRIFFTKYISESNIELFLGLKTEIWKYLGHTTYKVIYCVFLII